MLTTVDLLSPDLCLQKSKGRAFGQVLGKSLPIWPIDA